MDGEFVLYKIGKLRLPTLRYQIIVQHEINVQGDPLLKKFKRTGRKSHLLSVQGKLFRFNKPNFELLRTANCVDFELNYTF